MTPLQKDAADLREAKLCMRKALVELSRASALLDRRPSAPPIYYQVNRAWVVTEEAANELEKESVRRWAADGKGTP